ncbi:RNF5 [Mytilus coruscus]|uniref:RNF5 n=1 Tax=Mytilus coruscus TaxID=42192 RepID=A0A6J8BLK3_MYTCO|nr:RNF5 [Mytilus coruscus]
MPNCSVCLDLVRVATCCVPCGHIFCYSCIHRWISRSPDTKCPQCRGTIHCIQKVILEANESAELTEEEMQDPWSHSDWDNMLLSVLNIWKTSPVKRACDRVKGEFQRVDGDIEDKAEWLKDKTVFYLDILKTRAINHPRIVDLRTRWSNLNDDKKFWYSVFLVIILFLLVADVQNENGLFQLVTWPICKTMLTVLYEILRCLFYIPVRPVFGLIRCAIEVLWILVDIVINTILCLMNIVTILLLLPANLMNSFGILIPNLATKAKMFLPVVMLLYVFVPNFQLWCRQMLVRLQRNDQAQEH